MSLRCGCPDDGDEVVFGQCRKCSPQPQEPRERPWEYVLGPEEVEG